MRVPPLNRKRESSHESVTCNILYVEHGHQWTQTAENDSNEQNLRSVHGYLHVASFPLEIAITLIELFNSSTHFLDSKSKALSKSNYLNYVSPISTTIIFKPAYGSLTDKSLVYCSLWVRPGNFHFPPASS